MYNHKNRRMFLGLVIASLEAAVGIDSMSVDSVRWLFSGAVLNQSLCTCRRPSCRQLLTFGNFSSY